MPARPVGERRARGAGRRRQSSRSRHAARRPPEVAAPAQGESGGGGHRHPPRRGHRRPCRERGDRQPRRPRSGDPRVLGPVGTGGCTGAGGGRTEPRRGERCRCYRAGNGGGPGAALRREGAAPGGTGAGQRDSGTRRDVGGCREPGGARPSRGRAEEGAVPAGPAGESRERDGTGQLRARPGTPSPAGPAPRRDLGSSGARSSRIPVPTVLPAHGPFTRSGVYGCARIRAHARGMQASLFILLCPGETEARLGGDGSARHGAARLGADPAAWHPPPVAPPNFPSALPAALRPPAALAVLLRRRAGNAGGGRDQRAGRRAGPAAVPGAPQPAPPQPGTVRGPPPWCDSQSPGVGGDARALPRLTCWPSSSASWRSASPRSATAATTWSNSPRSSWWTTWATTCCSPPR